ncbi:protein RALF-like 19 [Macadamia integrifolia]|uniref:protein RALF-like 19 n=1 Tax=Macadamia integrifolia TaxID=60698 RepID=UPI001C4EED0D|nr:protein RALF-like 19 [Macadamia integrifolia]
MDIRLSLVVLLLSLALVAELSSSSPLSGDAYWVVGGSRPKCNGLVGDCIGESNEMMMDSDVARRGLYRRRRYISYEALKANRIPCRRPGQSYYDCRKNLKINPYRRSCTMATHCARDLR